jgi:hypothetical protein
LTYGDFDNLRASISPVIVVSLSSSPPPLQQNDPSLARYVST